MAESRSHKTTANRIAKKMNAEYNDGKGVDIKSTNATIEVETPETVSDALGQLRGHRGPAYIAGTNKEAVNKAKETAEGTTIGVMDRTNKAIDTQTINLSLSAHQTTVSLCFTTVGGFIVWSCSLQQNFH